MSPWRAFIEKGAIKELQSGSALDLVIHRKPNEESTPFVFREYVVSCALLWGNGYAEIVRNNVGEVIELWPLHPSQVTPKRNEMGKLVYQFRPLGGGAPVDIPARDMFHLRGPTQDGVIGRSMISMARESWALGLAAEQFGAGFFGNGGVPGTVIRETAEATASMDQTAIANLLRSFDAKHKGSNRAGKTAFLEKGFEIETIGMKHRDAQFLETRKFQISEVARWFRLPPHKIGDMESATFSNIEQQAIDFVTDAILPWTGRLEQEANAKLTASPNEFTKINLNALLRGDTEARGKFYSTMFGFGAFSTNDILALEDRNPVANGDQRFIPLNMISLDRAAKSGSTDTGGAIRGVLIDAHSRMIAKELNAVTRAHDSKKDLQAWAREFYAKHTAQMVDAVLPGARAAAGLIGLDPDQVSGLVDSHCNSHTEASLRDIATESWNNWQNRASAAADTLLGRLAGAAQ